MRSAHARLNPAIALIINTLSRMILFHRTASVLLQPLFDDGNMGTQYRLGHRLLPRIGRNPSVHYCLPNSPSTVSQHPSTLPNRLAPDRLLPPNKLFLFHRNHPLRLLDQQCLAVLPIPKDPLQWSPFTIPITEVSWVQNNYYFMFSAKAGRSVLQRGPQVTLPLSLLYSKRTR